MTTISERIGELRTLMANFTVRPIDPDDPVEGHLYFPFHEQPGKPRGNDPIAYLRNTILLSPETGTCQLFSGFQGTGKSTELRRLDNGLRKHGFEVLFVEGGNYINLFQPLEVSDLLLSVAVAVAEILQKKVGTSPARQTLNERISGFFSRIHLTQIEAGIGAKIGLGDGAPVGNLDIGKLRFEIKENPAFKSKVQDFQRGRLSEFLEAFRSFMNDARILLVTEGGACPVLIIDDLEKVQGSGPQQDVVQQQVEQIFSAFDFALKISGWHTIWASPPYLPFLRTSIAQIYDGYAVLPMVRLWSETDRARAKSTEGFAAMRKFLRLRGNVDGLVDDPALLDELILASSGHVRDLCRLMQSVLRKVVGQDDPRSGIGAGPIKQVVNDYVDSCQKAIYTDDHEFLRKVGENRRVDVSNQTQMLRIAKLFDTQLVMIYRNGSEWFDVSVPVQRLLARIAAQGSGPMGHLS
jgi:hypothetical protein